MMQKINISTKDWSLSKIQAVCKKYNLDFDSKNQEICVAKIKGVDIMTKKKNSNEDRCDECGEVHYNFHEKLQDLIFEALEFCSVEEIVGVLEMHKMYNAKLLFEIEEEEHEEHKKK